MDWERFRDILVNHNVLDRYCKYEEIKECHRMVVEELSDYCPECEQCKEKDKTILLLTKKLTGRFMVAEAYAKLMKHLDLCNEVEPE